MTITPYLSVLYFLENHDSEVIKDLLPTAKREKIVAACNNEDALSVVKHLSSLMKALTTAHTTMENIKTLGCELTTLTGNILDVAQEPRFSFDLTRIEGIQPRAKNFAMLTPCLAIFLVKGKPIYMRKAPLFMPMNNVMRYSLSGRDGILFKYQDARVRSCLFLCKGYTEEPTLSSVHFQKEKSMADQLRDARFKSLSNSSSSEQLFYLKMKELIVVVIVKNNQISEYFLPINGDGDGCYDIKINPSTITRVHKINEHEIAIHTKSEVYGTVILIWDNGSEYYNVNGYVNTSVNPMDLPLNNPELYSYAQKTTWLTGKNIRLLDDIAKVSMGPDETLLGTVAYDYEILNERCFVSKDRILGNFDDLKGQEGQFYGPGKRFNAACSIEQLQLGTTIFNEEVKAPIRITIKHPNTQKLMILDSFQKMLIEKDGFFGGRMSRSRLSPLHLMYYFNLNVNHPIPSYIFKISDKGIIKDESGYLSASTNHLRIRGLPLQLPNGEVAHFEGDLRVALNPEGSVIFILGDNEKAYIIRDVFVESGSINNPYLQLHPIPVDQALSTLPSPPPKKTAQTEEIPTSLDAIQKLNGFNPLEKKKEMYFSNARKMVSMGRMPKELFMDNKNGEGSIKTKHIKITGDRETNFYIVDYTQGNTISIDNEYCVSFNGKFINKRDYILGANKLRLQPDDTLLLFFEAGYGIKMCASKINPVKEFDGRYNIYKKLSNTRYDIDDTSYTEYWFDH